jgi:phage baseplate assembly protein W
MSPQRRIDAITPQIGQDLRLDYALRGGFYEDADLATAGTAGRANTRDLELASGLDAFTQAVANRLKTRKGELAALGHPEYGSRHHELIGQPNVQRTRDLIKLYVLQALSEEPRIEKVLSATVAAEHIPPRDTVRIELVLSLIGAPAPLNLVLPFSLGVSL